MSKKARRTTLPKDFEERLKTATLAELQSVFDTCQIDARGGYDKLTALMMPACPDELARWLVAQGADVQAQSSTGKSALHTRAFHPWFSLEVLIELGCDIHARCSSGTALHIAAARGNVDGVRLLLKAGTKVDEKNSNGNTPLEYALEQCQNIHIVNMVPTAQLLLDAGAQQSEMMQKRVEDIGKKFEWYRSGFNPKFLDATDAALQQLYKLFDATPAPRRVKHDGRSPIVAKADRWQEAHQELWDLLIPASGPADTVQGEVIRIAGRISGELYRNGGGNWDRDYRKMANSFLKLVATGKPLSDEQIQSCKKLIAELPSNDDANLLVELSVEWVKQNPQPMTLGKVVYKR